MSWKHISENSWHGVPLGYMISYFNQESGNQRNFTVTSSNEEIVITNLTSYTFYDLTIAGYTRKGLGPKHNMITVRTHEEGNVNTNSLFVFLRKRFYAFSTLCHSRTLCVYETYVCLLGFSSSCSSNQYPSS